jgi:dihydroneopterin aldolase
MSTARLFLTGIDASGRHGANAGEKDEPQAFVVDLDVEVHVDRDAIGSTVDYRSVIAAAREVVEQRSFDLIESLARAVAEQVAASPGVASATAIVHKPGAAISNRVQGVAAAVTATGAS